MQDFNKEIYRFPHFTDPGYCPLTAMTTPGLHHFIIESPPAIKLSPLFSGYEDVRSVKLSL